MSLFKFTYWYAICRFCPSCTACEYKGAMDEDESRYQYILYKYLTKETVFLRYLLDKTEPEYGHEV